MGNQITWDDWHDLGMNIDALAVAMNIPDYSTLAGDDTAPYGQPAVVPYFGRYFFNVRNGATSPTIISQGFFSEIPPALRTLANQGDLFFVADPDQEGERSCWCKMIFKVVRVGGSYHLVEVDKGGDPEIGSCQTMKVPKDGGQLDYDQHFIPAAYAALYCDGVEDSPGGPSTVYRYAKECLLSTQEEIQFGFQQDTRGNKHFSLEWVNRPLVGNFTWPIRAKWLDALASRLQSILEQSCGAIAGDTILKLDSDSEYLRCGDEVSLSILQHHYGIKKNPDASSSPGCMTEVDVFPWVTSTCGGNECGGTERPLVYLATLEQLQDIVDLIANLVSPHQQRCPCCSKKSCDTLVHWQEGSGDGVNVYNADREVLACNQNIYFSRTIINNGEDPALLTICNAIYAVDDNLLINGVSQAQGTCNGDCSKDGAICPCGDIPFPLGITIGPKEEVRLDVVDNCQGGCGIDVFLCLEASLEIIES